MCSIVASRRTSRGMQGARRKDKAVTTAIAVVCDDGPEGVPDSVREHHEERVLLAVHLDGAVNFPGLELVDCEAEEVQHDEYVCCVRNLL